MPENKDRESIIKFGNKLREVRIAKGFTQEGLANEANLPPSQICRIETGKLNPALATFVYWQGC